MDIGCPTLPAEGGTCPTRPVVARVTVLDGGPAGKPVAEVDTAADGAFRLHLPPGQYAVTGRASLSPTPAKPVPVVVSAGHMTAVTLVFDSGVRLPNAGQSG